MSGVRGDKAGDRANNSASSCATCSAPGASADRWQQPEQPITETAMSDHLTVSPYLRQSLDRSYRDFLNEQIARLETERRPIGDQLVMLREEREWIAGRE
ncbi:MAG: hypothetical protein ACREFQ_10210 [Stellaceae bacterium]